MRACSAGAGAGLAGVEGLLASVIHAVRLIPGVDGVIERILSGEVQNAVKTLNSGDSSGASEYGP